MRSYISIYQTEEAPRRVPTLHSRATSFLESRRDKDAKLAGYVIFKLRGRLYNEMDHLSSKEVALAGFDRSFLKA